MQKFIINKLKIRSITTKNQNTLKVNDTRVWEPKNHIN